MASKTSLKSDNGLNNGFDELRKTDGNQSHLDERQLALPKGSLDPVYEAKAVILNKAIQDIGMGGYQWALFGVVGFGWAQDNMWPIITSLILTPIGNEFNPSKLPELTLSQNVGLLVGAILWGFGCDIFGRRLPFNMTIGITAVFGLIAAGSPNFVAVCFFAALWSIGVGGNLPVDSAIFLEFLPGSHQYLLTVLSVFWAIAQVIANLIAWPLLGNFSCEEGQVVCTKQENFGWRYFVIVIGAITLIMFFLRFFVFKLYESPKYLMSRGKDAEAVFIVHELARNNGKTSWLTVEHLSALNKGKQNINNTAAISRSLEKFKVGKVKELFLTPKLAWSTSLITIIWAFIGLAFPLYNAFLPHLQATKGQEFGDGSTFLTYRNSLIVAAVGVPGSLVGGVAVELPNFGRKGTLALSTAATGGFLYGSTTAGSSNALLGWNCAFSFMTSLMYAVLYSYTPEIFPTSNRGTGNAITGSANRIFGIMAPLIAMYADLQTSVPVYVSGALFLLSGLLALILPFEPQGKHIL